MTDENQSQNFSPEELAFIEAAARFFENPGLVATGLNWLGQPIEYAQSRLPAPARAIVARASKVAIEKALVLSVQTVPLEPSTKSFTDATEASRLSGLLHTGAAGVAGAVGGFFGLAALPVELPIATILMLRSIADTAQRYGDDLNSLDTRLECMYVFSLGSKSPHDDAMESAYYTSRVFFSQMLKNASVYLAGVSAKEFLTSLKSGSAPVLARLITEIAAQFEVRVTKKLLAQAAPLAGAIGGAGINILFANFFQECARFHFGIKRLERDKGYDRTRLAFEEARARYRTAASQGIPRT